MPETEPQLGFQFQPERQRWTVSGLLARLRQQVEREFFDVWIEGEISNFRQSPARHCYFVLKDSRAQLKAVMFAASARLAKFAPRDGMQVLARARVSIYEERGDLQCVVEHLEPLGRGSLQLAFEQLKQKLEAEGLFAPARKRPLPLLPRRVGLITSARGAAVADMVRILRRRYPNLNLLLYPVQVQGAAAAGEICAALAWFAASRAAEVLIVGRGGGSLEDLQAFNEETVARAIAASPIPVISAVGHETDFTIADFVADLRAPTPSAAAELVVRAKAEWLEDWRDQRRRLRQALLYKLSRSRQRLGELARFDSLRRRLARLAQQSDEAGFQLRYLAQRQLHARRRQLEQHTSRLREKNPRLRLAQTREHLRRLQGELAHFYRAQLRQAALRLETRTAILTSRNPLRILDRGYALVRDEMGHVVNTPSMVNPGDRITLQFASGQLDAEVKGRRMAPLHWENK